ncbi:hypothetical protein NE237_013584 [Protea cynaroides]|uniref:Clp R domain-containing protein n=1 Tax=Protea cynaroides TaxID=273540 RepID=A0A9Q0H188_9MAGN|nr:hypothetical protein NE237_013584 [Protea cynaroides]
MVGVENSINNEQRNASKPNLGSTNNGDIIDSDQTEHHLSEEIDSTCSTPYFSAPSNPDRVHNGYYFSAPASPMHFFLSSLSSSTSASTFTFSSNDPFVSGSSEFEFSSRLRQSGLTTSKLRRTRRSQDIGTQRLLQTLELELLFLFHSKQILSVPTSPVGGSTHNQNPSQSSLSFPWNPKLNVLVNSLLSNRLLLRSSRLRPLLRKPRGAVATALFSLPTAKPERFSSGNLPNWSSRAIKSFAMGELEARKLKYPTTGTEALLMGILVEGTSQAAKFLWNNGITLFKVREETIKLLGKADMYFFSPEHPPLTEPAQRALDWAVDEKLKSGESGEITTTHLLLGIWSEKESAGHKIMAAFGFDDEKAKELAKSMDDDVLLSHR